MDKKARSIPDGECLGISCKICSSEKLRPLEVNPDLIYHLCADCDYCEKIPALSNAYADFIASQAAYYENPSINPFSEPKLLIKEKMDRKASIALRHIPSGSSILEIGPGDGSFLAWAESRGYGCTACEHSPVLGERLRERGFLVMEGEFEKMPFDSAYDAICSFHIIEHVGAPHDHVNKAYELTRPGGYMILATPNAASWQQRLFPRLSPNFDAAHLHVLSPKSLTKLAEIAGWEVVQSMTPEYTSGWLRVASKLLRKARKEDEGVTAGKYANASAGGRGAKAIALIAWLTWPLRYVQSKLGGGNEVLLVLRKPFSSIADTRRS